MKHDKKMEDSTVRLTELLQEADQHERQLLIQYNFGEDREITIEELVRKIRSNGSHDVSRWIRGEAHYLEIVREFADRIHVSWDEQEDEEALEKRILAKVMQESWNNMTREQQQAVEKVVTPSGIEADYLSKLLIEDAFVQFLPTMGYLMTWNIARFIAAAVARGSGVALAEGWLGVVVAEMLGPLGIVAGALVFLSDAAGPAYRKIIPTVILIAYLRQKKQAVQPSR
ncbi:MAG: hypothetical protein H7X79_02330 [Sporomusaceae bacterium]|nr:hypothetical protein [Sporomusaceae bacterium]